MYKDSVLILGNKIDCFAGYEELFAYLLEARQHRSATGYITVNNTHTMMEGFWSSAYQKIINGSYLSLPDGKPLQILGKMKGRNRMARLFGPTVMEKFIDWGRKEGLSHFFLGSSEENLRKLRSVIETKYPGTIIAGMISPPYKPIDQWETDIFIEEINASKPDFIWIGLGAPKQEKWMYSHHEKINEGLLFGIGAGFDYLAGNTKHAPTWMKDASLEWLFRLSQEPARLWKRYLKTIPPFVLFSVMELCGFRFRNTKPDIVPQHNRSENSR